MARQINTFHLAPEMTHVERAQIILELLAKRRDSFGAIAPVSNKEVMLATGADPSHFGVAYGQANSLLDIASLRASLPLVGQLVTFDRGDQFSGPWSHWAPFKTLLTCAPRLKTWADKDIELIRSSLEPGNPSTLWRDMEKNSKKWRQNSIKLSTTSNMS